ncbi:BCS1 N terminal-domain-containing protein [Daldinia decipiens]|uniref:BCS1 N terminal-domain-containing protein n=1 Tax=Daldinia decipiens TaxID=326647 RepID=UPI0020C57B03|nr:BCS1 N terminal-domain-containing protein [Daldinia decipiens]KAI1662144.1 BCS1 N terminal-domain-containing protein [Daldinia decipiens]
MATPRVSPPWTNESAGPTDAPGTSQSPQLAMLDLFFPGFSVLVGAVQNRRALILVWNYISSYLWEQVESHLLSVVDIRTNDEIYSIFMAWVAKQRFSRSTRRFVVNTNFNSRNWFLWYDYEDEEDEEDIDEVINAGKKKGLAYTPSFGNHYFWYRGRLLLFRRTENRERNSFMPVSEREEISISCFGRNPWILKDLLLEARQLYLQKDERKTQIYRGTLKPGSTAPTWQRCMSRASRPFSTVILNERTKQNLIDDVTDYLHPATQRWYANRGIPYRRGYLLYGPPGTGKSSLSLALAGFFKMRIYIVSLSSITSNEESLASLFAELPRRCVVLLEDIDTAGLTHTRDENQNQSRDDSENMVPGQLTTGNTNNSNGRLSLSGLLNILDGVASQEGRVLIMTTNHLEKLDKALIRPGRVDMIVKFGLADEGMTSAIFRAIFARLDEKQEAEKAKKRAIDDARVNTLAEEFSAKMPSHEFSPAEIQGYLMKYKRDAEEAVANIDEFITQTRKDRKEKESREAEEKRKAEAKAKAKGEKEKKEKEKKEEEAEDAKKEEGK